MVLKNKGRAYKQAVMKNVILFNKVWLICIALRLRDF